jgi:hypothetical protein
VCSALLGVIFCLDFDPFFFCSLVGCFFFISLFKYSLLFNHIQLSCGIDIIIALGSIHEDEHDGTNAKRLKLGLQLCKEPILLHQVYIAETKFGKATDNLTVGKHAKAL